MNKMILSTAAAFVLSFSMLSFADTLSGQVVSTKGNTVVVKQKDGTHKTLMTTDQTTYRQKKMAKHKMKTGKKMSGASQYEPMIEEDDWVEIVYSPANNGDMIVDDVIVYDD